MQSKHKDIDYKHIEHKLFECLVTIQNALNLLEFDRELSARAEECKTLIRTKQYNVAVMGEFKRGKSTLINALLGLEVLPADATPTTATINRITYGDEKRVVVKFKDGSEKEIGIDELSNYVTKITRNAEVLQAVNVKEAVVYYPTPICRGNIDIIDTPGLNDDDKMTKITIDMISNVDAVVVCIGAKIPFSQTECNFVCGLLESDGVGNIVFVVNRMDEIDDDDKDKLMTRLGYNNGYESEDFYKEHIKGIEERIRTIVNGELDARQSDEYVRAKAHTLLDNINVYGISARLALKGFKMKDDNKMREESRFDCFEDRLIDSVRSKQVENAIKKTIDNIKSIASDFEAQNSKRLEHFEQCLQETQSYESAVSEYRTDTHRLLDRICDENDNILNNVIADIDKEYGDIIRKAFIKELSNLTVDENTHEHIRTAMEKAQKDAFDTVRQTLENQTMKHIYDIFKASAERMVVYRKDCLGAIFEKLGISFSADDLLAARFAGFLEARFKNVSFRWVKEPIPDVDNLSKVNVMASAMRSSYKTR